MRSTTASRTSAVHPPTSTSFQPVPSSSTSGTVAQGWCPPLTVFRRLGVRTRREIDLERYAIKALRGDLPSPADRLPADTVLDLAAKR
jgi:hypothetical protein